MKRNVNIYSINLFTPNALHKIISLFKDKFVKYISLFKEKWNKYRNRINLELNV